MSTQTIKSKAPSPMEALFKGVNGSLPLILYVAPLMVWALIFNFIGFDTQNIASKIVQSTASNILQEDINLISEKVKDSDFFKMTKDDIIKSNQNDNFLFQKAKSKIEKSQASKSVGNYDENIVKFDSQLNPIIEDKVDADSLAVDMSDLNYEMNKMKEERNFKYEQKKKEIAESERKRKQKIHQAIEDNRKKREAKEQQAYDEYQMEKTAYEHSVNAYHGNGTIAPYESTVNYKAQQKKETQPKPKFGFNTAIGLKDDFNFYDKHKAVQKVDSTSIQSKLKNSPVSPINDHNNIAEQIPLFASIDQARKVRSGQKVQIRIMEDGFYQGLFIPANSIIYGICTISNNRVNITVPSINYNDEIIRTNMIAYDMDGIQGVYVDGSFNDVTRDVLNEGLRSGSRIGFSGSNNPLGNLTLGIGRKANNRVSVHIPTGYQILLYHGSVNKTNRTSNSFTNNYNDSSNSYGY